MMSVRLGQPSPEIGKTGSQGDSRSAAWSDARCYGRLTLVLSPLLVIVNVPEVVRE
jgi:hypothetical protein